MKQLFFACALAACAPTAPPYDPDPRGPAGGPAGAACPAIGSSDWAAWVDAMPSPGPRRRPILTVTGKVLVPTGGYRVEWADMRVAESYPVQVFADLRLIPPTGGATQAVTTLEVRGSWPIEPPVGSLTVRCGSEVLARISPVETAH